MISFSTELKIKTTTATLIPLKACCTRGISAKFERRAAMAVMITSEGKTIPREATMPPIIPFCLVPTKVAVLMAMMPGVHCPMA